jgi:hypothetical protein
MKPSFGRNFFHPSRHEVLSQVYSGPKLLDMTPFLTLRLDHNNQALTKRFAYQGTKSDI